MGGRQLWSPTRLGWGEGHKVSSREAGSPQALGLGHLLTRARQELSNEHFPRGSPGVCLPCPASRGVQVAGPIPQAPSVFLSQAPRRAPQSAVKQQPHPKTRSILARVHSLATPGDPRESVNRLGRLGVDMRPCRYPDIRVCCLEAAATKESGGSEGAQTRQKQTGPVSDPLITPLCLPQVICLPSSPSFVPTLAPTRSCALCG